MRFATYLPYDWKETTRDFRDYCSRQIGKELIYCIPADTPEDFILGSLSIAPVCPEQLIIFEVKHFYMVEKIAHYHYLQGAPTPHVFDSNKAISMFFQNNNSASPYQDFTDFYHNSFDKTKFEFLVPKSRIVPIKTIDVKKTADDLFAANIDCWNEHKREYVDKRIKQYTPSYFSGDCTYERELRNLDAKVCFENFILNYSIANTANEIWNSSVVFNGIDFDVYWTLHDKFNKKPCEQRLGKLINYIGQFIRYEQK